MADLKHRVELTMEHRDLILQYGYVSGRLEAALRRWPQGQAIRRGGMTGAELHLLIGDLSYSYKRKRSICPSDDQPCNRVKVAGGGRR